MKTFRDFDERERKLYYKCRNQVLGIIIFEALIAVVIQTISSIDRDLFHLIILIMVMIPVAHYRIQIQRICEVEKEDIGINSLLALMWSAYWICEAPSLVYICIMTLPLWGLVIYTYYLWQKQKNDDHD